MDAFKPYTWNNGLTMKNRLVMAPMTTYSANEDLTVSEGELRYYEARGKTLGMVITAAAAINTQAQAFPLQISAGDDRYVPSLKKLARAIKVGGARAIIQLHHGGRMNDPSLHEDTSQIVSASAVPAAREGAVTPRAMTVSEIQQTIADFASATRRAIDAGFDGVELHGANTYLLQQFFSPHSNRRTDAYGGTRDKRMQMALETIQACREVIQTHAKEPFLLGYRFSPEELENPGITLEDTVALIESLKRQPLDFLHVSLGRFDQTSIRDANDTRRIVDVIQAALTHDVPLIGVGGIDTRESVVAARQCGYDLVASGMALLADPYWGETIQHNEPIKTITPDTLPAPLFNRLHRFKKRLETTGYTVSNS